ncbi:hypothetical protein LPJ67_004541, partial [Coemansia sp. RSA 1938]
MAGKKKGGKKNKEQTSVTQPAAPAPAAATKEASKPAGDAPSETTKFEMPRLSDPNKIVDAAVPAPTKDAATKAKKADAP